MGVNAPAADGQRPGGTAHRDHLAPPVAAGDVLESRALRLRATVISSDRDLLRADVHAARGGNGGPLHRHLRQEERFLVREGTLRVREGPRGARLVEAGDEVAIRASRAHTFTVVSERAYFIAEFRPAWEIAQVFRDVFALVDQRRVPRPRDLAALIDRYPEDFFYSALAPTALQRALAQLVTGRAHRRES
jgi:mannose-6-phosphate isomerase-like protein (cupin superfamily)